MTAFEERKSKILASLAQPAEIYTDASPKGSIDEGIRDFVDEINQLDGFVTTSSCAGRIAVYQEGASSVADQPDNIEAVQTSAGGKGGGQWLFVSHDPVQLERLQAEGSILSLLSLPDNYHASASLGLQHIHFKFEPLVSYTSFLITLPDSVKILHVLCSSLDNARKLLGAALSSGFRESGISSISSEHDMVLVAIRTNGLAFDSIIAAVNSTEGEKPVLLVTEQYLRMLVHISNQRFEVNQIRKHRLRSAFLQSIGTGQDTAWEPAEVRRARKQAEGLAKRQSMRDNKEASRTKEDSNTNGEDSFDLEDMLALD